jgi:hypothetical protein
MPEALNQPAQSSTLASKILGINTALSCLIFWYRIQGVLADLKPISTLAGRHYSDTIGGSGMIKEIPQAALHVKDQLQELVHLYELAV